ncbi:hypothetical protein LMG29542_08089 [Paraburkholderia humisilvae]|uniref:Uncharacterized protein n=1 Tax=Paraburkholderia humisilvae TaxID=627669 RepID=A0A6J5FA81_9BURK|nr:hypothetical protein LMG29542_08089 [Paraburkholderia humisilvae]
MLCRVHNQSLKRWTTQGTQDAVRWRPCTGARYFELTDRCGGQTSADTQIGAKADGAVYADRDAIDREMESN